MRAEHQATSEAQHQTPSNAEAHCYNLATTVEKGEKGPETNVAQCCPLQRRRQFDLRVMDRLAWSGMLCTKRWDLHLFTTTQVLTPEHAVCLALLLLRHVCLTSQVKNSKTFRQVRLVQLESRKTLSMESPETLSN